jgi:hypothetical protein
VCFEVVVEVEVTLWVEDVDEESHFGGYLL